MSLVSVVVPIYNCEKDIEKSVKSILAQSYQNLQVILVDDGSTDASGMLCDRLAAVDKRVLVLHKSNGGVSSARNAGMEKCLGEYVLFVDSDDYLYPEAVQILVSTAQENAAEMVIFGFCYNNVTNKTRCDNLPGSDYIGAASDFVESICPELVRREFFNPPWNKLIRRELIEKNGLRFNERISICEDMAFSMQLLMHVEKLAVVNKVLYDYCIKESGSLVFKYNENFIEAVKYYLSCSRECVEKYENSMGVWKVVQRICCNRVYMHFLKLCSRQNVDNKLLRQEKRKLFESEELAACIDGVEGIKKLYFGMLKSNMFFGNRIWAKMKGF